MKRALSLIALIGAVVAANALTNTFGVVTILGLTATAGTWVAGFAFLARDGLHEWGGRRWVIAGVLFGAVISALLSPMLALASATAFLVSELADYVVYSPLRESGWARASIVSNIVGSIVDTVLFLWIAGFPLDGTLTQVVVKVGTTTAVVLGVRLALLRKSVRVGSRGGRNA